MKIRTIIPAALLALMTLVSCDKDPKTQPALPLLAIGDGSAAARQMSFGFEGDTKSIEVTANRKWTIDCSADWVAVDFDEKAEIAVGETTVLPLTVSVLRNNIGNDRKAVLRIKCKAVYRDIAIVQAANPNEAPAIIYVNDFGPGVSDGSNPSVADTDIWRQEQGAGAAGITYYRSADAKITVRTTGASSGYGAASGGANLYFGTGSNTFAVGSVSVHEKLRAVDIKYGIKNNNGKADPAAVPVRVSRDGSTWIKLNPVMTVDNGATEGWSYCTASFKSSEAIGTLYVMFTATAYRLDDLSIEKGSDSAPAVDWTKGDSSAPAVVLIPAKNTGE